MSESELRTKVAIGEPRDYEKGGVWWKGMQLVEVAGPPSFALNVLIQDGAVSRISLLRIGRVDVPSCKARFEWLVQNVAKQYGAPDTNKSYEAIFKFEDGAFIEVQSFINKQRNRCFDSIVHFRAPNAG